MIDDVEWRGKMVSNGRGGLRPHVRLVIPSRRGTRIVCHDYDWVADCLRALTEGLSALCGGKGKVP